MSRNWAGTHEYTAPRIERAQTVDDVQRLVREPGLVHALGTRHSFTDLPDTTGTLIDLAGLEPGFALHADEGYATIGAGTRYGELALLLDEQGWALHNLGSLPHIAVGGATATGTHGSGDANGVLTTAVRALPLRRRRRRPARGAPRRRRLRRARGRGRRVRDHRLARSRHPALVSAAAGRLRRDHVGCRARRPRRHHRRRLQRVGVHAMGRRQHRLRVGEDAPRSGPRPGARRAARRRARRSAPARRWARATTSPSSGACQDRGCCGSRTSGSTRSRPSARRSRPSTSSRASMRRRRSTRCAAWPRSIQPHLIVSELRTAAADDLWLSGAYGQDVVIIHFTWYDHRDEVYGLLPAHRGGARPVRGAAALGQGAPASTRHPSPACTRGSPTPGRCSSASTRRAASGTRTSSGSACATPADVGCPDGRAGAGLSSLRDGPDARNSETGGPARRPGPRPAGANARGGLSLAEE